MIARRDRGKLTETYPEGGATDIVHVRAHLSIVAVPVSHLVAIPVCHS